MSFWGRPVYPFCQYIFFAELIYHPLAGGSLLPIMLFLRMLNFDLCCDPIRELFYSWMFSVTWGYFLKVFFLLREKGEVFN